MSSIIIWPHIFLRGHSKSNNPTATYEGHLRSNNELEKGAEERTCHFSHRHCSKPIYRFDIRLESEPKIPTPNFFNFPEKKLNFTIENLDNNGNEYIYISVPLVALIELSDYIKGNTNYQFER